MLPVNLQKRTRTAQLKTATRGGHTAWTADPEDIPLLIWEVRRWYHLSLSYIITRVAFSLSLSFIITRVAPHCVNTLRTLRAAYDAIN